jgi:cysteinyl-tRNA synthetase
MAEMIAIIQKLIGNGHAYAADGHVLFDVPSMPDYGKLSKRPLDEMIAGARVDVAPYKRGPMDFVLWKPSAPHEPGWESPWGRGRPGWHIECSAMSWKHLGEMFDIHGGGIDLVFPHHENEVAQTCSAFGHDIMARFWMHNGHLQVEGEKMSKSLGNFVTIHELLHGATFGGRSWPGEVLRLAMLKTHYRQPIDFTVKGLEESYSTCVEWFVVTHDVEAATKVPDTVLEPLSDDLNTPAALAAIHELHVRSRPNNREAAAQLKASLELLGIELRYEHFWRWLEFTKWRPEDRGNYLVEHGLEEWKLQNLIVTRNAARAAKNWAESDRIRDELAGMGIALKDNKDGTTTWEVKR